MRLPRQVLPLLHRRISSRPRRSAKPGSGIDRAPDLRQHGHHVRTLVSDLVNADAVARLFDDENRGRLAARRSRELGRELAVWKKARVKIRATTVGFFDVDLPAMPSSQG